MYQVPSDKCAVDANQGLSPGGQRLLLCSSRLSGLGSVFPNLSVLVAAAVWGLRYRPPDVKSPSRVKFRGGLTGVLAAWGGWLCLERAILPGEGEGVFVSVLEPQRLPCKTAMEVL